MHEPRTGALTRRDSIRGGRRQVDAVLEPDEDDGRPIVVLAEDDAAALDGLARWLENEGFQVLPCATFGGARAELSTRRVAALLTDIRLAEFNGLHLVQIAVTLHPDARLIVFSGHDDDVLQAEARNAGAVWCLKPLDLGALREYLAPLLPKDGGSGRAGSTD